MRKLLALSLLLMPLFASAQNDTSYFSADGTLTDKTHAHHFLVPAVAEGDGYRLNKYYANGVPLLSASNKTKSFDTVDGYFTTYYPDGKRNNYGNYHNNAKIGQWTYRYEDVDKVWYVELYNYKSDTNVILTAYHKNGKLKRKEYITGETSTGTCYTETGDTTAFTPMFVMPATKVKGGANKFISEHLNYPDAPRAAGIQGRVMVVFMVTKSGEIANVSASFEDADLAKEAVRVIKLMKGLWIPGTIDGQPTDVFYTLPVSFRLEY